MTSNYLAMHIRRQNYYEKEIAIVEYFSHGNLKHPKGIFITYQLNAICKKAVCINITIVYTHTKPKNKNKNRALIIYSYMHAYAHRPKIMGNRLKAFLELHQSSYKA